VKLDLRTRIPDAENFAALYEEADGWTLCVSYRGQRSTTVRLTEGEARKGLEVWRRVFEGGEHE
jgi:hypothetical protein